GRADQGRAGRVGRARGRRQEGAREVRGQGARRDEVAQRVALERARAQAPRRQGMKALNVALALAVIASASPALAAGGHGFSFTVEGFYIIDFVILAVLLWAVTKGPIKKFFLKRHEDVKN